jgi:hypothetical protein
MKQKIRAIKELTFTLSAVNRAKLTTVGEVNSGGWTEPELGSDRIGDGSLNLDFLALAPTGAVIQVLLPIVGERIFILGSEPQVITVHSETNAESVTLPPAGDPI